MKKDEIRLAAFVRPEYYKLSIKADIKGRVFTGEEQVTLSLLQETDTITLNAKELEISRVFFSYLNKSIECSEIIFNKEAELASFIFNEPLPKIKGTLNLRFQGELKEALEGFYLSSYEQEGKQKYIASTQFESIYTREAFPCFDEPAMKAVFELDLTVDESLQAISNTPIISQNKITGGWKRIQFAPTPKMSTYLLAYVVGEFESYQTHSKRGVLVQGFATKGKKNQLKFGVETGAKVLDFFEKYFRLNYPLEVLNLIAIPDFSAGAMENWGAITFREAALLLDPKNSSTANKQQVATVVAHEISHQWFGNLVTMRWWNDLWLNEGFATYAGEYVVIDALFPEWKVWLNFVADDLTSALRLDGLKNTHPIEVPIEDPHEIGQIFDAISYAKGACVIRMLVNYLGETDFKNGLRYYLKEFAYQNTETKDLWKALSKSSGKKVGQFMRYWTSQPGYPLLEVSKRGLAIEVKQQRFYSNPASVEKESPIFWEVPLQIRNSKNNKIQDLLLKKYSARFKDDNFLKLNAGQTGFYRVKYSADLLPRIYAALDKGKIGVPEKIGLLSDAIALAESGLAPATEFFELIQHFKNESDYNVWAGIVGGLGHIGKIFEDEKFYPEFEKFSRNILKPKLKELGLKKGRGEGHETTFLRNILASSLIRLKDVETIEELQKNFTDYLKTGKLDPDLRSISYLAAAQNGNQKTFNDLFDLLKKENLQEERSRLLRALSMFDDPGLTQKALDMAFSASTRLHDKPLIILSIASRTTGKELVWQTYQKRWPELWKLYRGQGHELGYLIKGLAGFSVESRADEIRKFFKKNNAPGYERNIQQTLEQIGANSSWRKRDRELMRAWLQNFVQD